MGLFMDNMVPHFCGFLNKYLFIYLFLAALGLCCCARAFSGCCERGYSLLRCVGSVVVARGLSSCSSRALGAWAQ